ncbi:hypothetical protein Tco_0240569 [Tanacetum coccineum]
MTANRISPDPDRTWVDEILRFTEPVGYGPTTLLLRYSDRNVVEEEDGEQIRFLGGNSSSGTKKYRGSNSSDGGNTRDGVKIAGKVIGSGDRIDYFLEERVKNLLLMEWEYPIRTYKLVQDIIHRGKSILNIRSRAVGERTTF